MTPGTRVALKCDDRTTGVVTNAKAPLVNAVGKTVAGVEIEWDDRADRLPRQDVQRIDPAEVEKL